MQDSKTRPLILGRTPQDLAGVRLDKVVLALLEQVDLRAASIPEEIGSRGVRRLWSTHDVLLDGRPAPKGARAVQGAVVSLRPKPETVRKEFRIADWTGLRVVAQETGRLAALFKPAGLHSMIVAGAVEPSLEETLPLFWPKRFAVLLNRLDQPTSGLVLVALSEKAAEEYRIVQEEGRAIKRYLALLEGRLDEKVEIAARLDTAKRVKVRVEDRDDQDPLRKTVLTPLKRLSECNRTLVSVDIKKGARHQIRAHAAFAGLPIVGDDVYGSVVDEESAGSDLYLHHFLVRINDFQAKAEPLWPQWPQWREGVKLV